MAVNESVALPFSRYIANGISAVFSVGFEVRVIEDIVIYKNQELQYVTSDYIFSGSLDKGMITFVQTPLPGDEVIIFRDTESIKLINFKKPGLFRPEYIDTEFENVYRLINDMSMIVKNSVRFADYDIGLNDGRLDKIEPNKIVAINNDGDGVTLLTPAEVVGESIYYHPQAFDGTTLEFKDIYPLPGADIKDNNAYYLVLDGIPQKPDKDFNVHVNFKDTSLSTIEFIHPDSDLPINKYWWVVCFGKALPMNNAIAGVVAGKNILVDNSNPFFPVISTSPSAEISVGDRLVSYRDSVELGGLGFLIENGQAISRTDYVGLFSIIGEDFGAGDGTTTFNLPSSYNINDYVALKDIPYMLPSSKAVVDDFSGTIYVINGNFIYSSPGGNSDFVKFGNFSGVRPDDIVINQENGDVWILDIIGKKVYVSKGGNEDFKQKGGDISTPPKNIAIYGKNGEVYLSSDTMEGLSVLRSGEDKFVYLAGYPPFGTHSTSELTVDQSNGDIYLINNLQAEIYVKRFENPGLGVLNFRGTGGTNPKYMAVNNGDVYVSDLSKYQTYISKGRTIDFVSVSHQVGIITIDRSNNNVYLVDADSGSTVVRLGGVGDFEFRGSPNIKNVTCCAVNNKTHSFFVFNNNGKCRVQLNGSGGKNYNYIKAK